MELHPSVYQIQSLLGGGAFFSTSAWGGSHDLGGHWHRTMEFLDRVILSSLDSNRPGLNLKELIEAVANAVGDWLPEPWQVAAFSVKGHLDRLQEQEKVRAVGGIRPLKWERT